MLTTKRAGLITLALCSAAVAAQPADPAKPASPAPPAQPATPAGEPAAQPAEPKKELTPQERLAATEKLYNQAKTYRDEGTLTFETTVNGKKITDTKPFTTAFVRDGGFRWEVRHSTVPSGPLNQRYAIWSTDGKSFKSYWTLTQERDEQNGLAPHLARAGTVSAGASAAVLPLLNMNQRDIAWGIKCTDLTNPVDKGKEAIDGVDCWKIEGTAKGSEVKVNVWLDNTGLIRKLYTETPVDPAKTPKDTARDAKPGPKFTSCVTITLKPFVNEAKIDDDKLATDDKDGSQPAKK